MHHKARRHQSQQHQQDGEQDAFAFLLLLGPGPFRNTLGAGAFFPGGRRRGHVVVLLLIRVIRVIGLVGFPIRQRTRALAGYDRLPLIVLLGQGLSAGSVPPAPQLLLDAAALVRPVLRGAAGPVVLVAGGVVIGVVVDLPVRPVVAVVIVVILVLGVVPQGTAIVLRHGVLLLVDAGVDAPLGLPVGLLLLAAAGALFLLPLAQLFLGKRSVLHCCLLCRSSSAARVFRWTGTPRSFSSSMLISRPRIMAWSKSSQTRRRSSSTPSKSRVGSM